MTHRPRVLAGYDGTRPARHALDWAAHQSARRAWPLVISMAHPEAIDTHDIDPAATPAEATVDSTDRADLHDAAREAQAAYPSLEIASHYVHDNAVAYLTEQTAAPGVVVIGTRGLGSVRATLFGGVADKVAANARGPVVIVPQQPHRDGPIVVGVDGGADQPAVQWALAEARREGCALRLIRVQSQPPGPRTGAATERSDVGESLDSAAEQHAADGQAVALVGVRADPARRVGEQTRADAHEAPVADRGGEDGRRHAAGDELRPRHDALLGGEQVADDGIHASTLPDPRPAGPPSRPGLWTTRPDARPCGRRTTRLASRRDRRAPRRRGSARPGRLASRPGRGAVSRGGRRRRR